jgi:hypothetical protein
MGEPFGRRNRSVVTKPARAKLHKHAAPPSDDKSRFYLVVAAAILVLVVGGYALAL